MRAVDAACSVTPFINQSAEFNVNQESNVNSISPEAIESVQQLAATWKTFVTDYGPADVRDLPGMSIRWADSTFPFWNCITLTEQGIDQRGLEKRLGAAVDYMRGKCEAGFLWLFEDLLDAAAQSALPGAVEQAGLALSFTGFGMCADIADLAEPAAPGLTFVRVSTEAQLLAYADLNSRAYAMPLEAGRDGLQGSDLWKNEVFAYLGLQDGIPVSCAATVQTNGRLFLALVATAPEAQGKGFGEATVRKALYEGARATGLTQAVLHATPAGAPVYARIGFRRVATVHFYGVRA